MELRHLRYFVAVAEELSFRRASERLHVVQPALSRQIKDLEFELRVRLLDRDTVRVRLTDAGRIFLEEARQILAHTASAAEMAREAEKGLRGHLTVGNVGPITASFMSASLKRFRTRFPEVDVTLIEIEPADQIPSLEANVIQIAFTIEKNPVLSAYLRRTPVARSPMCAVIGIGHRLAARRRVSLVEVASERLLCYAGQRSQTHADLVHGILEAHGLGTSQCKTVEGFESLLAMIAGGQGVSLMPQHVPISGGDSIKLIPLREVDEDLVFEVSVVWRDQESSTLARNFVSILVESLNRRRHSNRT